MAEITIPGSLGLASNDQPMLPNNVDANASPTDSDLDRLKTALSDLQRLSGSLDLQINQVSAVRESLDEFISQPTAEIGNVSSEALESRRNLTSLLDAASSLLGLPKKPLKRAYEAAPSSEADDESEPKSAASDPDWKPARRTNIKPTRPRRTTSKNLSTTRGTRFSCGTTETPEWRNIADGDGVRRLYCNACGLSITRKRKARGEYKPKSVITKKQRSELQRERNSLKGKMKEVEGGNAESQVAVHSPSTPASTLSDVSASAGVGFVVTTASYYGTADEAGDGSLDGGSGKREPIG